MRWKEYKVAASPKEASEWLVGIPGSRLVAGATDIMVLLDKGKLDGEDLTLIDVSRIPELSGIRDEGDALLIGAGTTMAQLAASDLVGRFATALAEGARSAASPMIRQVATVAGNLVNASPAADTVPGLLTARSTVEVFGPRGAREMRVEDVQTGPGTTSLEEGEVLIRFRVPKLRDSEGEAFLKMGKRKALSISIVNVAARVRTEGDTIVDAVAVLGAVAPRFVVLGAELLEILRGKRLTEAVKQAVQELVADAVSPISDLRASAEYRRAMAQVLAWRALNLAYARALSNRA